MLDVMEGARLIDAEMRDFTIDELHRKRAQLDDRVTVVTRRRLEITDRLQLATLAPYTVPREEVSALRAERQELDAELEELVAGMNAVQRLLRARRHTTKG